MKGNIVVPLSGASTRSKVKLEQGHRGYDMLTLYTLLPLDGRRQIAVLRLLGQMSGAAAVIGIDLKADDRIASTRLRALGSFGLFMTGPGDGENPAFTTIILYGKGITDTFQTVEHLRKGILLKLDLEEARNELSLPDQDIVVEANTRVA